MKEYIDFSKEFLLNALSTEKKTITNNCVGCGACKAVCKVDAVSLTKNHGGFIKAYIDTNKCVNCGLCSDVCPVKNVPVKSVPQNVFAFKANDEIRKNSTSGGAGTALAEAVIKNNGSVYGAHLDDNFYLRHIRIDSVEDIGLLQGTKYIQSDMTNVFYDLKNDILSGTDVLFIGTPCQTASVKQYVLKEKLDIKNLYLCDIICHGVPSPKVFKDYVMWLDKTEKDGVKKYYFRNKAVSWRGDSSAAETKKSDFIHNKNTSAFMNMYYSNNITNEACFECRFTSQDRVSDLTISDFWGIENDNPEFEDELGVSMVMVNTSKGKELFNTLDGEKIAANVENVKQSQLKQPPSKPQGYDVFWQNYKENGIEYAIKNFGIPKTTLKSTIYNLIKGK
jgi:coenzyme F420-reducing hydrogenase beta subunit